MIMSRDSRGVPENPIIGMLRNWYQVGKMFGGEMSGSSVHPDGTFCYTEYIKNIRDRGEMYLITSFSGRQYILYKDQHHPTKRDVEVL